MQNVHVHACVCAWCSPCLAASASHALPDDSSQASSAASSDMQPSSLWLKCGAVTAQGTCSAFFDVGVANVGCRVASLRVKGASALQTAQRLCAGTFMNVHPAHSHHVLRTCSALFGLGVTSVGLGRADSAGREGSLERTLRTAEGARAPQTPHFAAASQLSKVQLSKVQTPHRHPADCCFSLHALRGVCSAEADSAGEAHRF